MINKLSNYAHYAKNRLIKPYLNLNLKYLLSNKNKQIFIKKKIFLL